VLLKLILRSPILLNSSHPHRKSLHIDGIDLHFGTMLEVLAKPEAYTVGVQADSHTAFYELGRTSNASCER
jgi:hypothetical protein